VVVAVVATSAGNRKGPRDLMDRGTARAPLSLSHRWGLATTLGAPKVASHFFLADLRFLSLIRASHL
jgi:hypothetical protein